MSFVVGNLTALCPNPVIVYYWLDRFEFHTGVNILHLLSPVVIDGIPAQKSRRTTRSTEIFVEFGQHVIQLLLVQGLAILMRDLLRIELRIFVLDGCWQLVLRIGQKTGSLDIVEFEILVLEGIPVL